jgi:hypothetical protein
MAILLVLLTDTQRKAFIGRGRAVPDSHAGDFAKMRAKNKRPDVISTG